MKRILITGVHSYVGNNVQHYLQEYNKKQGTEHYYINKISLRNDDWKKRDFSVYDVIFHVAGIAHIDAVKLTDKEKQMYYVVNRDLSYEVAKKAKSEGVKQFVFMSSILVYGGVVKAGKERLITNDTPVHPENVYGDSKMQAEQLLEGLQDASFKVAVIRSPMIYGKNCKGNYALLEKIARRLPIFLDFKNTRSTLYVLNLAEFVRLLVDSGSGGVFFPQNAEFLCTSRMIALICEAKGHKMILVKGLSFLVILLGSFPGKLGEKANKAFGSLMIDQSLSRRGIDGYQIYSLEESIQRIEGGVK